MVGYNIISESPYIIRIDLKDFTSNRLSPDYYSKKYIDYDENINTSVLNFRTLSEVSEKITDGTHHTPNYLDDPTQVPFLSAKNVCEEFLDFKKVNYISLDEHEKLSKRCPVKKGDLLLSKIGRIGIAKVNYESCPFSVFVSVALIKHKIGENYHFIEAFLNSKYGRFQSERFAKGISQKDLHLEDIGEILIPKASKIIENYIGGKLLLSEILRQKAIEMISYAEKMLFESVNLPIINEDRSVYWRSDIYSLNTNSLNPSRYRSHFLKLEDLLKSNHDVFLLKNLLSSKLAGGITPLRVNYMKTGEFGFVRVQNIKPNFLDRDNLVYIDELIYEQLSNSIIQANDVLMTITGYPGIACCVMEDDLPLNMNQHSVTIRVNPERVDPFYLAGLLNSWIGKFQTEQKMAGATRDALNYDDIKELLIPVVKNNKEIGKHYKQYAKITKIYKRLVATAKQDVEQLVEGSLDTETIERIYELNGDKFPEEFLLADTPLKN